MTGSWKSWRADGGVCEGNYGEVGDCEDIGLFDCVGRGYRLGQYRIEVAGPICIFIGPCDLCLSSGLIKFTCWWPDFAGLVEKIGA
jgi:hypothetical protein